MALFTLSDIKFKVPTGQTGGTKSLAGSQYDTNIFRYPLDIGNYDKGHYVVIHINEQVHTQYKSTPTGDDPTIIANRRRFGTPTASSNASKLYQGGEEIVQKVTDFVTEKYSSNINVDTGVVGDFVGSVATTANQLMKNVANDGGVRGIRTIRRTTDTIALYMPDTLAFTHQQSYSDMALGGGLPAAALSAGASAVQTLKSGQSGADMAKAFAKNLTPYLASAALNKLGPTGQFLFAAGAGMVQNPMLELLYSSPSFRTFRLDFVLYPRSQKEAAEVMKLINRLKFHQAPEIRREFNGFFLVPPSEFDIKFMYNGSINPNLPEISTCVLDGIDIDYAPNGFSAYEVPGELTATPGGTGTPVAIRLGLQFKETEIMTKDNFAASPSSTRRSVQEQNYANSLGDFPG
jgi:hypothetical protein